MKPRLLIWCIEIRKYLNIWIICNLIISTPWNKFMMNYQMNYQYSIIVSFLLIHSIIFNNDIYYLFILYIFIKCNLNKNQLLPQLNCSSNLTKIKRKAISKLLFPFSVLQLVWFVTNIWPLKNTELCKKEKHYSFKFPCI